MEKMVEMLIELMIKMMVGSGIILIPILLVFLVRVIGDISYYNNFNTGGYSQDFTYQGVSSNQGSRREDYYHDFDFKLKDTNQPDYKSEDPKGYYKILEVDYNAGHKEIVTAYHRVAKKYHPDIHPETEVFANEMMKKINLAKEVLTDPIKRAEYDQEWK